MKPEEFLKGGAFTVVEENTYDSKVGFSKPSLGTRLADKAKEFVQEAEKIDASDQAEASKFIQKAGKGIEFVGGAALEALKSIPGAETLGAGAIKVMQAGASVVPAAIAEKGGDAILAYEKWAEAHPEASANLRAAFDIATILPAPKLASTVVKTGEKAAETAVDAAKVVVDPAAEAAARASEATKKSLFGRPQQAESVEDVVKQAEQAMKEDAGSDAAAALRTVAEKASAKPNLVQRWVGISDDIKNRISGKQEKLKEYFDVAHARNNFDTVPTPLEYGAKNVEKAVKQVETVLNDTGSDIGKFRKKVGTYQATIDQVGAVENEFVNQLTKLNLEVKDGAIRKVPGKVTRVSSDADIKVLQDLYEELRTVKENPNLEKLIDLRTLFDNKINFSKEAREASRSLDPFSRQVRKKIADVGAEIVGPSEAANLTKYSEVIDAYNELRSYTDRRAGAEFLLKQVLSERGRTPREIMNAVKDITGIDLMDDAVMASLATDLIGNVRQKGLFRQEISKAGLDALAATTGDKGALLNLIGGMLKKGLNAEKQYLKAAE